MIAEIVFNHKPLKDVRIGTPFYLPNAEGLLAAGIYVRLVDEGGLSTNRIVRISNLGLNALSMGEVFSIDPDRLVIELEPIQGFKFKQK